MRAVCHSSPLSAPNVDDKLFSFYQSLTDEMKTRLQAYIRKKGRIVFGEGREERAILARCVFNLVCFLKTRQRDPIKPSYPSLSYRCSDSNIANREIWCSWHCWCHIIPMYNLAAIGRHFFKWVDSCQCRAQLAMEIRRICCVFEKNWKFDLNKGPWSASSSTGLGTSPLIHPHTEATELAELQLLHYNHNEILISNWDEWCNLICGRTVDRLAMWLCCARKIDISTVNSPSRPSVCLSVSAILTWS